MSAPTTKALNLDIDGSIENTIENTIEAMIQHLEREALLLSQAEETLHGVHQAIVQRNHSQLSQQIARQTEVGQQVAQTAQQRQQLRVRLSDMLTVPVEAVTISQLLRFANPAQADRLRKSAERLGRLARMIDQLSYQNATLARQQMDLFQRLLDCLTGSDPGAPRYQANGDAETSHRQSVIEMRC